jgi:diguanylate cyclase (GGDEF)-like protein
MAGLRVYRAFSRVFPRSFRAKLMAVMVCCVLAPLTAFVVWLLNNNGADPQHLVSGVILALLCTIAGAIAASVLIYQLLKPLRMIIEEVEEYYSEKRLPELPEDGRDEMGMLMRGINRGLREIDSGMRELERVALEDPLTGALSRRGTDRALQHSVERAEKGDSFMLYVMDVDNLKPVNDELGHAAGDRLLIDMVDSARRWMRDGDWIGRWGGDEFLVGVFGEHAQGTQAVQRWLRRLAIADRDGVPIRVSIGCAQYRPGLDALALYREADAAMYAAKARGGGNLVCDDGHHDGNSDGPHELARSA